MRRLSIAPRLTLIPAILHTLLSFVKVARAQESSIRPGGRLRITHQALYCPAASCEGSPLTKVGKLVAWTADTFIVSTRDGLERISRELITRIDVSRSRNAGGGRGALVGAAVGGGIGAALGTLVGVVAIAEAEPARCQIAGELWGVPVQYCSHPPTVSEMAGVAMGVAMFGGMLGAVIGATRHDDVWAPVLRFEPGQGLVSAADSVSGSGVVRRDVRASQVSVGPAYTSRGIGVRVRLTF